MLFNVVNRGIKKVTGRRPIRMLRPQMRIGPNRQLANQLHKPIRWRVMLSKHRKGEENNKTPQGEGEQRREGRIFRNFSATKHLVWL
jgi:hypothetical protein